MKKVKQSKKRWAWTESQKRKHYSLKRYESVPKMFIRFEHKENKTYEKIYLHKVKNGYDVDYLELKIKNQVSSAGYNWW
jgi:hypothetical protein